MIKCKYLDLFDFGWKQFLPLNKSFASSSKQTINTEQKGRAKLQLISLLLTRFCLAKPMASLAENGTRRLTIDDARLCRFEMTHFD